MFKYTPVENLKVKFYFQSNLGSNCSDLVPNVLGLGVDVIVFDKQPEEQVIDYLHSIKIYLNVMGKWKDYDITLLPQSPESFQESLLNQHSADVGNQSKPFFIVVKEELKSSFKMDLNLARSR